MNAQYKLLTPTGEQIEPRELMTYLGTTVYANGTVNSELNQKLGKAFEAQGKFLRY